MYDKEKLFMAVIENGDTNIVVMLFAEISVFQSRFVCALVIRIQPLNQILCCQYY